MKIQALSGDGSFRASSSVQMVRGPYINIPGYSYDLAANGRFLLPRSEYQEKRSTTLEVIESWTALLP